MHRDWYWKAALRLLMALANLRLGVWIPNPFRGGGISKLFSTHPPTEERVERLLQMRGLG